MNWQYNKVVLFVYSIGIVLMATAKDECAKLNESCDFFPPIKKDCCEGMACSMLSDLWAKNGTSVKGECLIAPMCRGPGQPCGNHDGSPATFSSEDNKLALSADTTCCDDMECDSTTHICNIPDINECRVEGQRCGILINHHGIDDDLISSGAFGLCCPGLACGALYTCYEPPNMDCRKEGESCRLIGCCDGLHCNPVENDHTGEEQDKCQKKTCNTDGTCSTLGGSGCCDSHYCNPHWGVVGLCERRK